MTQKTVHNPDSYMADLRQILSQGKKRIGLLGIGSTYGADKLASSIIARNSSRVLNSNTPGAYNFYANIAENSGATLGKSRAAAVIGSQGQNVLSALGNVSLIFK